MKSSLICVPTVLFGLLVALSPSTAVAQDAKSNAKLQVGVNYTGVGGVDDKHKIYVVLWDSPEFVRGGGMPVEILPTSSKTGTVTFTSVQKSPAYVSAVFDPKGQWDGQSGPPPEGSSLGLYSKSPGLPEPIEVKAGETAKVTVSFDDSVKMPGQGGR